MDCTGSITKGVVLAWLIELGRKGISRLLYDHMKWGGWIWPHCGSSRIKMIVFVVEGQNWVLVDSSGMKSAILS